MSWIGEWWNQVSATVAHGFEITVVGMALVFFTLGLVIVAMILLTKLPWLQAKERDGEGESHTMAAVSAELAAEPAAEQAAKEPATQDDELERVAAIAVAMLRGRRTPVRPTRVQRARSTWKGYGRAQQLGL